MTNVTALSHDGSQHEVMAELIEHYNKGEVSGIYVAFTMPNGRVMTNYGNITAKDFAYIHAVMTNELAKWVDNSREGICND